MANFTTSMTVVGNLTRDIELRYTQSGQALAAFTIASTPRTYDRETKQYTDGEAIFTNCTLWGKPAENLAASAGKGSRVIATGALKSRTYQDREGNQKTATDLVVDEIGMSTLFASYTKGGGAVREKPVAQDSWGTTPDQDGDTPW